MVHNDSHCTHHHNAQLATAEMIYPFIYLRNSLTFTLYTYPFNYNIYPYRHK